MLNQVNFIGNIGRIESKTLPQGKKVTKFSIAVTEKYKDVEETLWMDIVTWEKLAETCENYLSVGKKVFVSGKLKSRTYEKDGVKHTRYEVTASQVIFLSPKSEGGAPKSDNPFAAVIDESIPF